MANPKPSPCNENPANPNNSGVVGDWPCDTGSGTTLYDRSSSGNNGTLTSSSQWASGTNGPYLTFNGSQIVTMASGSPVVSNKITVAVSVNPVVTTRGDLVTCWTDGHLNSQFNLLYGLTSGVPQFFVSNGTATPSNSGAGSTAMSTGTWYRLVGVYDGNTAYVYLNGVLQSQNTVNITLPTSSLTIISLGNNQGTGSGGDGPFTGSLDGPVVVNTNWTLAQIQQDYADAFARFRSISPIQASTLTSVTAAGSATTSFGQTVTIGDAVKVDAWGICTSALGTPTVTDNQTGNTYSPVVFGQDTTTLSGEFSGQWLLPAVVGNSGTFKVIINVSSSSIINLIAREYNFPTGTVTAGPTNSATGNSSSPAGGAVTTSVADSLISTTFGSLDTNTSATIAPPAGFYLYGQQLGGITAGVGGTSDEVVSTTQTSLNPTSTLDSSYKWAGVTATYYITPASSFTWQQLTESPDPSRSSMKTIAY